MILEHLETPKKIPLSYLCDGVSQRRFVLDEDIFVTLSDGYELHIEQGFETDLSSVPNWMWSLFAPIDRGFIGDLIHDKLWTDKQKQFEHFQYNIFESRRFADNERLKWREHIVPEKGFKNKATHRFIRWFGGFFYSRQLRIPE